LTGRILPQPEHLAVASGCLVFVPEEVEHAVGGEEGDLLG
jgi:hypothetical protein